MGQKVKYQIISVKRQVIINVGREFFNILGWSGLVLSSMFFITAIILFFKLDIRGVIKDKGGMLEQKQIEEIRAKNIEAAQHRGKVDVFEELEKQAKPKRSNTGSLKIGTAASRAYGNIGQASNNAGTTVLRQSAKAISSDFIIEKNIVFVNTKEVI